MALVCVSSLQHAPTYSPYALRSNARRFHQGHLRVPHRRLLLPGSVEAELLKFLAQDQLAHLARDSLLLRADRASAQQVFILLPGFGHMGMGCGLVHWRTEEPSRCGQTTSVNLLHRICRHSRGGGAESQESLSAACRLCVMSGLTLLAKCAGKFAQLQVSEDATVGHVKRELAALFSRTQGVGGATGCVRLSTTSGRLLAPDDARLFDIGVSSLQLLHVHIDSGDGEVSPPSPAAPEASRSAGVAGSNRSTAAHASTAPDLRSLVGRYETELQRLAAKVDDIASAMEERTRAEIARQLSSMELSENARLIKAMTARLDALEASTKAALSPCAPVSPEITARFARLEKQLAESRTLFSPPAAAEPQSTVIQDLQARILALESGDGRRLPMAFGSEVDSAGDGRAGDDSRLASVEASIKTLEEKIKLQAKRTEQIIKEQRQRAVAQGAAPRTEESKVTPKSTTHSERTHIRTPSHV